MTGHASDASAAAQDAASGAAGRAQKVAGDSYDAAKGSAYDATASGRLAAHEAAAQAGSTWEKAKNVVADVVDKVCPLPLFRRLQTRRNGFFNSMHSFANLLMKLCLSKV